MARNYLQEACANGVNNGACAALLRGCECVACASDGDCGTGEYCDSGACSTYECTSHDDCGSDQYCYDVGECYDCQACPEDRDFITGCCPSACSSYPSGFEKSICGSCDLVTDCAVGYSCNDDTGQCVSGGTDEHECTSHEDCGGGGYCDAPGLCDSCSYCHPDNSIDGQCPDCSASSGGQRRLSERATHKHKHKRKPEYKRKHKSKRKRKQKPKHKHKRWPF